MLALATLPVIELRGAIPVGYWLQLNPIMLTFLAVIGLVSFFSLKLYSNLLKIQDGILLSKSKIRN